MRRVRTVGLAVLVVGTMSAAALVLFRAATEPDGSLFGISNHAAMVIAWWVVLAVVPVIVALDVVSIDQADWWAAGHSETAWFAATLTVPFIGMTLYALVIRGRVAGAWDRRAQR
jgi:hypothetical protein